MKIFALITVLLLVGGAFLITKQSPPVPPVSNEEIIDKNGVHWHPKVIIYKDGVKEELVDGIGLGAVHEPIHTHTEDYKDGVVHIEKQGIVTKDDTKLGKFFQIWGRKLSDNGSFKMYVNGNENTDYESYLMKDKDIIEIKYE
ncbi:MAG: hypothetical protein ACD_19C00017G0017 [uncultured bacterium]|nr:MAG: hypothetical protein ACD_19C00017G0017 [uncultured bacterium]